jgi:hypothetical protein
LVNATADRAAETFDVAFPEYAAIRRTIVALTMAAGWAGSTQAQSARQEDPIPETPRQSLSAIEKTFATLPAAEPLALFPQIREQLKDAPAFLRDSTASINIRSYYRDALSNTPTSARWNEAWATGSSVAFETGRLADLISGGFVLYTSFPTYAPSDHDGSGLLAPGQQSYGVLGQLYGKLHLGDEHEFIAGRYLYNTPFMGPQDNRMSPKTFYGYVLRGSFGDPDTGEPYFRYGGGYIAAVKDRNATDFISMSRAAGADVDRGTGLAGGLFSWGPVRVGAIDYYTQDTMNIFYSEAKFAAALVPGISAALSLQFTAQNSTGSNLLNGGTYWATNDMGAELQLGYRSTIFTAAYTMVNRGFGMQTPWSANPSYTDGLIQPFNRAGETALMAGLSHVFTPLGLPGVGASVFYFRGWTEAPAAGTPVLEDEWNFNLEWRPAWKSLQGLWLRAQYGLAKIDQNGVRSRADEIRLIANYTLKMY